jgi:hypothetical protein
MVHFEIETTGLPYMYISTNITWREVYIRITIRDQEPLLEKPAKRKIEGNAV